MNRLLGALRFLSIFLGLEILALLLLITGPSLLADGKINEPLATSAAWLPLIRHDPTPTPQPTPTLAASTHAAHLQIPPLGGINASTFNRDSFILRNESTNDRRISVVRIDLSTAVFPDMVFDPYGQGGDTLAKDLRVDEKGSTGFEGHSYAGEHGGGFDILELRFQSFDPREEFRFSVDVDPNSIRGVGAPGPNESGSVSGLELMGSTVTVQFDDGTTLTNNTFRIPGSDSGSEVFLRNELPPAPAIAVQGLVAPPATVSQAKQTILLNGAGWQPATVLVLEGGLFLNGVPSGGYDIKPYAANSLVAISEHTVQTSPNGQAAIDVTLTVSMPEAGLNYVAAAFDNHYGNKGAVPAPIALKFEP
jgi:hypothetical protein